MSIPQEFDEETEKRLAVLQGTGPSEKLFREVGIPSGKDERIVQDSTQQAAKAEIRCGTRDVILMESGPVMQVVYVATAVGCDDRRISERSLRCC